MKDKTILLPTDFSDNSRNAIKYALNLFKDIKCQFLLLHCYQVPQHTGSMLISIGDILEEEAQKGLKKELSEIEKFPEAQGVNFSLVVREGEVDSVIESLINKREDVKLVVMGTKGASGMREFWIGSNTAATIRRVMCPVIAIPESASYRKLENIVFAADFKFINDKSIIYALISLAEMNQARMHILNIIPPGKKQDIEEAREGYKLHLYFENIEHTYHFIEDEDIPTAINKFVMDKKVDMVAMIARKNNFFDRVFKRSVTNKVALHTHTPLLALHDLSPTK